MRIGMGGAAFVASVLGIAAWSSYARADTPPGDSPNPADEPEGTGDASDDLDLVKLLNVEVSTATKTAESLDDAPAVITVVTREDIVRWGYQTRRGGAQSHGRLLPRSTITSCPTSACAA